MANATAAENAGGGWKPFLWIVLASALAHLWCLGSQFYLDDLVQIRDNEAVRTGDIAVLRLSGWSYLFYHIQYRVFGMSAVGFHAVNWLLHTGVACALYALARDLVRGRYPAGVALFAALLFAVHPLASEIPNYARTQDLAWVTLFSLLAAGAIVRFLNQGGWLNLVACGVFMAGAMFSKGPGLFHAVMMVGAAGAAVLTPGQWMMVRRKAWIGVVGGLLLAFGLWELGFFRRIPDITEPRWTGHAYTLSRVFWEFAWRSVVPVALCSDHEITETLVPAGTAFWAIPDVGAKWAAITFLALIPLGAWLAWKKSTRLVGVCLLLYVLTILFRVLYLVPEFMPEYRIYPGLPWFCLGAAVVLAGGWKFLFETVSPKIPVIILLGVFCLLSAKRSFVWHDLERLTADVLERYPARARALWVLHKHHADEQNWKAIIERHHQLWPEVERQFVTRNQRLAPAREIPSGDFVLAMVGIFGNYAQAVAHQENMAAGLRVMAQLEAHMTQMKMTPENKPVEWGYFTHSKALVLETGGNFQAAADCLREMGLYFDPWKADLRRIEEKLAATKPGL